MSEEINGLGGKKPIMPEEKMHKGIQEEQEIVSIHDSSGKKVNGDLQNMLSGNPEKKESRYDEIVSADKYNNNMQGGIAQKENHIRKEVYGVFREVVSRLPDAKDVGDKEFMPVAAHVRTTDWKGDKIAEVKFKPEDIAEYEENERRLSKMSPEARNELLYATAYLNKKDFSPSTLKEIQANNEEAKAIKEQNTGIVSNLKPSFFMPEGFVDKTATKNIYYKFSKPEDGKVLPQDKGQTTYSAPLAYYSSSTSDASLSKEDAGKGYTKAKVKNTTVGVGWMAGKEQWSGTKAKLKNVPSLESQIEKINNVKSVETEVLTPVEGNNTLTKQGLSKMFVLEPVKGHVEYNENNRYAVTMNPDGTKWLVVDLGDKGKSLPEGISYKTNEMAVLEPEIINKAEMYRVSDQGTIETKNLTQGAVDARSSLLVTTDGLKIPVYNTGVEMNDAGHIEATLVGAKTSAKSGYMPPPTTPPTVAPTTPPTVAPTTPPTPTVAPTECPPGGGGDNTGGGETPTTPPIKPPTVAPTSAPTSAPTTPPTPTNPPTIAPTECPPGSDGDNTGGGEGGLDDIVKPKPPKI